MILCKRDYLRFVTSLPSRRSPQVSLTASCLLPSLSSACPPDRMFGATGTCSACSKAIPAFEMVMRARNNNYHLDCFACEVCQQRFCVGDKFFLSLDNRVLCERDFKKTAK